ncbi:MAG: hypothetical protein KBD63_08305, partial [Bacteriovoracaceae bacterium]|nr:hypothetical protein [Bacteriovoracaceae bacterium]
YVLFTDVDLGNATVTYQFTDGREALKNIFIQEDALSYDVFAPVEIKSKFVNFYENIPLSQKTKDPLHLNENQLGLLSGKTLDTSKQIEKRALNRFEVPYYLGFKGERIYLSLNHEKVTYYLGFLEQEDLEVPSPEYLSLIYAKHEDIHSVNLKQQCVVLIKSSSAIDEIKSSARSIYGGFEAEISVIALDGLQYNKEALSKEMEVRSILISGHQEGMFDLTIRQGAYTKHLKTYCNPKGPLLVEHI